MPPVTEIALVVGPMEPQTKRGFSGVEWRAQAARAMAAERRLSSKARAAGPYFAPPSGGGAEGVEPEGAVGEAVFAQHERRAAEGVGLHDVAAGGEVALVDAVHHVRTGGAEVLVAPLELGAAEVSGGEGHSLEGRAGGAVEHEDALLQGRQEERRALVHVGGPRWEWNVEDRVAHGCLLSLARAQNKKPDS